MNSQNNELNKKLLPTHGIKHWGLSGYSSILPRIKFGVTGQESSPQSPTFHTATVSGYCGAVLQSDISSLKIKSIFVKNSI